MVDLQTAMAAAQASDRRSRDGRGASDEKKKRRSGSDLGIEPFDPVKYVNKEKADTSSMWLVILFAFTVTALMRYVLMPSTTMDKTDILYMLPLVMIILIPQIHRTVMPERFHEHYTKGTWFRAAFLYTFTFLSLSFLLVNPPFGDIVAPQVSNDWGIAVDNGDNFTFADGSGKDNLLSWQLTDGEYLDGSVWLLFGLADNVGNEDANVTVSHRFQTTDTSVEANTSFWTEYGDEVGTWKRVNNRSAPILLPHGEQDQPFALNIGESLAVGDHIFTVEITEQGDPWVNTRVYEWTFSILAPDSSAE